MQDAGWVMANGGFGIHGWLMQHADQLAQAHVEGRAPKFSYNGVVRSDPKIWRTYTATDVK